MFRFFRRSRPPRFDLARIGDAWDRHPLVHDGVAGSLDIRRLPAQPRQRDFPALAMAWVDKAALGEDIEALSQRLQQALEGESMALLVLRHDTPSRMSWYAYADADRTLDAALGALACERLHWGINDDPDWHEYAHARRLVGA